jgi:Domain of unknown function (DUF4416)
MQVPTTIDALLVAAVFSRHPEAHAWARRRLIERFGPIALESQPYTFAYTGYYAKQMGPGLTKQLLAFERLAPLSSLADIKNAAIKLEGELQASGKFPEERPVNIDPGFLGLGKFMLATTKDQAHRIYLKDGIFAEVTLRYQDGEYVPWPWTYADYREDFVREFLKRARELYKTRLPEAHVDGET